MPKKGSAYNCPPKRFTVPPCIAALGNYAKVLTQSMRATHQNRMNDANRKK